VSERDEPLLSKATQAAQGDWQSCRADDRCSRGARYVTGADIVRISQTLALEPWHFTQTAPAGANDRTGIVVDEGRRRVKLMLANAAHGCVFLIRTPDGTGRCGLGDLAPISCRMFPAELSSGGGAGQSRQPGPSGKEWTEADLDQDALAEARREWAADRDHWYEVISRWNASAAAAGGARGVEDFQRYLLEAQSARKAGAAWPEEVAA
jgi:Fe-S-cluster containining protein